MNEKKLEKVLQVTLSDLYHVKNLVLNLDKQELTFVMLAPLGNEKKSIKEIVKDIFEKYDKHLEEIYIKESFMGRNHNFVEVKFYF